MHTTTAVVVLGASVTAVLAAGTAASAGSASCRTEGDRVCRTVNASTGKHYLTIYAAGEPVATIRDYRGPDVVSLGTIDGHPRCFGLVGDTTVVTCADGFTTTS